jgi:hypothetical protein
VCLEAAGEFDILVDLMMASSFSTNETLFNNIRIGGQQLASQDAKTSSSAFRDPAAALGERADPTSWPLAV